MSPYEIKKIQVEYKNVNASREAQEMRLMEMEMQMKRIEESIQISIKREEELLAQLKEAQA